MKDLGKELAALLGGIKSGRPEQHGSVGVFIETEDSLELDFIFLLSLLMGGRFSKRNEQLRQLELHPLKFQKLGFALYRLPIPQPKSGQRLLS